MFLFPIEAERLLAEQEAARLSAQEAGQVRRLKEPKIIGIFEQIDNSEPSEETQIQAGNEESIRSGIPQAFGLLNSPQTFRRLNSPKILPDAIENEETFEVKGLEPSEETTTTLSPFFSSEPLFRETPTSEVKDLEPSEETTTLSPFFSSAPLLGETPEEKLRGRGFAQSAGQAEIEKEETSQSPFGSIFTRQRRKLISAKVNALKTSGQSIFGSDSRFARDLNSHPIGHSRHVY